MNELAILVAVAVLVMLFVLAEIAAAVLPLIIVLTMVPPEQRQSLAELIAACDSSRRLRLWPALRTAVKARRQARDRNLNTRRDRDAPFTRPPEGEPFINTPRVYDPAANRAQTPTGPRLPR